MPNHLYNSTIGKFPWFIKRFGARELVMKPLRLVFAPLLIPLLRNRTFQFQGKTLPCFYHRYNMTWAGERSVEIPIAKVYIDEYASMSILEIGNVMAHYFVINHEVVDKFEKGNNVINSDVIDFSPNKHYDLILSISTFEHIGFDDESGELSSAAKIKQAIGACRKLLNKNGKLVITVPIGYNSELDALIKRRDLHASNEFFLHRVERLSWEPCSKEQALKHRYKFPFPYGNAVLIAEFTKTQDDVPL